MLETVEQFIASGDSAWELDYVEAVSYVESQDMFGPIPDGFFVAFIGDRKAFIFNKTHLRVKVVNPRDNGNPRPDADIHTEL